MSFTVEWPLLTNRTWATSGTPDESASFPYNATEWDAIESVQLEIVASGQEWVEVSIQWTNSVGIGIYDYDFEDYGGAATVFYTLRVPRGGSAVYPVTDTVAAGSYTVWLDTTIQASESNGVVTVTLQHTRMADNLHNDTLYPNVQRTFTVNVGGSAFHAWYNVVYERLHAWDVQNINITVSAYRQPCVQLTPGGLGRILVTAGATPQRYVSADFFPSLVNGTTYRLEVLNGGPNFAVYGARLLIRQSNSATKTIIPFEIGHYFTTSSSTYVDIDPLAYYQHVASRFGGTVQFFFEVELVSVIGSTAYCALRNTANTIIAELSTTSTSFVVLRSPALSLADGMKYKVSLRGTGNRAGIRSARVLAKYTAISKLSIPRTVFEVVQGISAHASTTSDFIYWDPAQYPSVVIDPAVVEHMIRTGSGMTVTSSLWNGAATSYSVSLVGAHDLITSSAAALPSSITSYQGRGVATAGSSLNRIRLWRLIVPVVLSTPVSVARLLAGEWFGFVGVGGFPGSENLVTALVTRNILRESLMGARAAQGIVRENLATAVATRGIHPENLGTVTASRNIFRENLVLVVMARGPFAEYHATAKISQPVSVEQLAMAVVMRGFGGEVLVLVPVSRVLHGEWGQVGLVVVGGMIPAEWLLGVRTIQSEGAEYARQEHVFRLLHSEALGMTLIGRPGVSENLVGVIRDGRGGAEHLVFIRLLQHPVSESLVSDGITGRTASENLGLVGRTAGHGGELLVLVRPSRSVFAEGLARAIVGRVVTAEELTRVLALRGLTLEDLSEVIARRGDGLEWLTVVDSLRAAVGESLRGTGVVYIIAAEDLLRLIASGALGADWKGLHTVSGPVRLMVLTPEREVLVILPERRVKSVD